MKHYSPAALARLVTDPLRRESDLVAQLRRALAESSKAALAARLGVSEWRLSMVLRGVHPLPDALAGKLGYRRVTRFEPIERPIHADRGRSAERIE